LNGRNKANKHLRGLNSLAIINLTETTRNYELVVFHERGEVEYLQIIIPAFWGWL